MSDSFASKQNWWKSKYLWILLQMQIFCIASIPNWSPNGILIKTPDIHTSVFPSFQIMSSWIFLNNFLSGYTCQKYFSLVHVYNVVCVIFKAGFSEIFMQGVFYGQNNKQKIRLFARRYHSKNQTAHFLALGQLCYQLPYTKSNSGAKKKSQFKTTVKLVMPFGLAERILPRLSKYHCLLSAK